MKIETYARSCSIIVLKTFIFDNNKRQITQRKGGLIIINNHRISLKDTFHQKITTKCENHAIFIQAKRHQNTIKSHQIK